jgi:hypothetical protein
MILENKPKTSFRILRVKTNFLILNRILGFLISLFFH